MEYGNKKLIEFEQYINNRKVAIIGLEASNLPLIDYFHEKKSNVTVFDEREIGEIPKKIIDKITNYAMKMSLGKGYLTKLQGYDLILRSPKYLPTIAEIEEEATRGAIVTTDVELMMTMCPCQIIGVTGSCGKTTVATLIYEILKETGYTCYINTNAEKSIFTELYEMMPDDKVVLELNSFQLIEMEISPSISVVTNINQNDIKGHQDFEEYIEAEKNIFKYQDRNGITILNYDNEITRDFASEVKGKVIFFSSKEKLDNGYIIDENVIKECDDKLRKHIVNGKELIVKGKHNYENICCALAVTRELTNIDTAIKMIKNFAGVENQLEFVKEINGVKWYNDSASTTPYRTITGIEAFDEEITLITGGEDEYAEYELLVEPILNKVKTLILMGQTSGKIFDLVKEAEEREEKDINIYMVNSLSQAVILAKRYAEPGQVILFSPASPCGDMFKSVDDRGCQFKNIVNKM